MNIRGIPTNAYNIVTTLIPKFILLLIQRWIKQLIYLSYFSGGPNFRDILAKTLVLAKCYLTVTIDYHSFVLIVFFLNPYLSKEESVKRAPSPTLSLLSSFRSLRKTTSSCGEKYNKLDVTFSCWLSYHLRISWLPIVVKMVREYIRELENVHSRAPGLNICSTHNNTQSSF